MKYLLILWSICTVFAAPGYSATLTPVFADEELGIVIADLALPDSFVKDISSGFETLLLIRIDLLAQGGVIAKKDASISVRYDLWDEQFIVRQSLGEQKMESVIFKQAQDVVSHLATLRIAAIVARDRLSATQEYIVMAEVLTNPVDRERIERVREWVAANSNPTELVVAGAGQPAYRPKPNDLFNRIFEQYTRGAEVAATWRAGIASKPFKPQEAEISSPNR